MVDFTIGNPMDLGNRKTTRILSWPDGSCRPASKQEIELWDEISRLQEQIETQRIGHQLTAKEATDYLIRAKNAEAGLEEMTRSCLAERAGRLAAEAERDRLREAGAGLANAAYNLARNDAIPTRDRVALKTAQERWDAALQKEPQPAQERDNDR